MRVRVRISLLALMVGGAVAVSVPAAAQAAFGVQTFAAINCGTGHEHCAATEFELSPALPLYSFVREPDETEALAEGFTQAGGHVPYGITDFQVKTTGTFPNEVPEGILTEGPVTHVRTDVATGLATSPSAVPQCSSTEFGETEAVPGSGFFTVPTCEANTIIGVNKVTAYAGENGVAFEVSDLSLEGKAYNLEQKPGLASEFGVALKLPKEFTEKKLTEGFAEAGNPYSGEPGLEEEIEEEQYYAHTLIEGNVEWGKQAAGTNEGDYHDYFNIEVSPKLPLIASRLVFKGTAGNGNFITNATSCPGDNTSYITLTSEAGAKSRKAYTTPVGLTGCNTVPFSPALALTPLTFEHDEAAGLTAEVAVPQFAAAGVTNSSEVQNAEITLPEGMTLNPAAAGQLEACTPAQARIHSATAGTSCPSGSIVGTVNLEVPTLPPGALTGNLYLGGPETGAIKGPPYIVYIDAESTRYGVSVRVEGKVKPNPTTGRLTVVFENAPAQPFTSITMKLKAGPYAPIASPLGCGTVTATSTFSPYTGLAAATPSSAFAVTGCAASTPFSLSQSTASSTANAGAHTAFVFTLSRADGQQYLSQVSTVLPEGLTAQIPVVPLCVEPLANEGKCPSTSKIGTATVLAGAGATPYSFPGSVYLTGPYDGAPYGLSVEVPAVAGPFNFGTIVTRATINVNETNARVTVASTLPTIAQGYGEPSSGVPIRLRGLTVDVERAGYLLNPTNCSAEATETTLTSTLGATQSLSSPFQVSNCSALKFKPTFASKAGGKTSKATGAGIETTINQPSGEANIASVLVQLPKQLPSRLTTLQKSCPEATAAINIYDCPPGSKVGGVRANTPLLPSKMTGSAYLVSHGGEAFPDLDLVLEADGVRVILVGHTKITNDITTTYFQTLPDVPVTSITVNLPTGPNSALAGNGNLCNAHLVMPTTITGENGKKITQNTVMTTPTCGVQIVGRKVVGDIVYLTVKTFAPGRISGSGAGLSRTVRHLRAAHATATLKVPLSGAGRGRGRPFSVRVRVGFVPSNGGIPNSAAFQTVTFG